MLRQGAPGALARVPVEISPPQNVELAQRHLLSDNTMNSLQGHLIFSRSTEVATTSTSYSLKIEPAYVDKDQAGPSRCLDPHPE